MSDTEIESLINKALRHHKPSEEESEQLISQAAATNNHRQGVKDLAGLALVTIWSLVAIFLAGVIKRFQSASVKKHSNIHTSIKG